MNNDKHGQAYAKLMRFLESYRIKEQTAKYTHIAWGGDIIGKFSIKNKQLSKFHKLHKQFCECGMESNIHQVPQKYMFIVVDIDLVSTEEDWNNTYNKERLYDNKKILKSIEFYREAIKSYLDVNEENLVAYVFEKHHPTVKEDASEVKDGVHIIFPEICARSEIRHLIRTKVVKMAEKSKLFTGFKEKHDKIFDAHVVDANPWALYGACKPHGQTYKLSHVIKENNDEEDINNFDQDKLLNILNFTRYSEDDEEALISSIDDDTINEEFKKIKPVKKPNKLSTLANEDIVTKSKLMVSLLAKDRSTNHTDWLNVGMALHNTCNSLLQTWIDFSKQSKKYKKGECDRIWTGLVNKPDGLTIRSLEYWAKIDNYDEYIKYKKTNVTNKLIKSLGGDEYSVADAVYEEYKDKFVCASIKNDTWYEFEQHKWIDTEKGVTLYMKLATDIINKYHTLAEEFHAQAKEVDGIDKTEYQNKAALTMKLIMKMGSTGFRERIMKDLKNIFYIRNFQDKLDTNINLICFNNGIYDLSKEEFRDGQPEDYLSLCTNRDYSPYDPDNEFANKINKFFKEILPDDKLRKYVLTVLSSCVNGKVNEKFFMWTGTGANGKSITIELFVKALGDYSKPLPSQLITQKRNSSSSASPEIAQMVGIRAGFFQETEESDKLHVGQLKEYTGGDYLQARPMYKEIITFKPQLTMFLICNILPQITARDGGSWRRIRVVNFASEFVDKPKADKPHQFKIDDTLKDQLEDWASVFISYLIEIHNTWYKVDGLSAEPDCVIGETQKYKQNNDTFAEFFDEKYFKTDNLKHKINAEVLWADYRVWFKDSYPNSKLPNRPEFIAFLKGALGECIKGKKVQWVGYIRKTDLVGDTDSVDESESEPEVTKKDEKKKYKNKESKQNVLDA
jgi:P4 family phage/plasmid primase-like protien